jgi:hypothetical protein
LHVSSSAVIEWGNKVRTKHSLSWSECGGDGGALFYLDDEVYNGIDINLFNELLDYTYDGKIRRYSIGSTIGYADEVYEGITLAVGARGFYENYEFDEDASGAAQIAVAGMDTISMETPYSQGIVYGAERLRFDLPASLEWRIKSFFVARLGLFFSAYRFDYEYSRYQSAEIVGYSLPFDDISRRERRNIQYSTGVSSRLGFEFNLKDKLIVDLLNTDTRYLGFSYVSLRYRF